MMDSNVMPMKVASMSTTRKTKTGFFREITVGTMSLRLYVKAAMPRSSIPKPWAKEVCKRLKNARFAAGYTQETISEALGMQVKTYAKYESRSALPPHLITTVCRLLDLDPFVFLDGYGRDARPGPKLRRVK